MKTAGFIFVLIAAFAVVAHGEEKTENDKLDELLKDFESLEPEVTNLEAQVTKMMDDTSEIASWMNSVKEGAVLKDQDPEEIQDEEEEEEEVPPGMLGTHGNDNEVMEDEEVPVDDETVSAKDEVVPVEDINDEEYHADNAVEEKTEETEVEVNDALAANKRVESVDSALRGYDVVRGDPINIINSGTVRDEGMKKQIFYYDPDDARNMVQITTHTGCSSTKDASVISTVGKFRQQLDKEMSMEASVSGSGFGVSASFAFSASRSSTEIEDHIAKKHGSLTLFTMTCSKTLLDVGNVYTGLPPFTWKFANFITNTLGDVNPSPSNIHEQKALFKALLVNYGTHYIYEAILGARVTTTHFLSKTMTSTMSQSKIKACASASASVDYMAVSAKVSANGCSASDKSKFNSRDEGSEKVVKNSFGTTKVPGDGKAFNMDAIKSPRPIQFKLAPIIDLFVPKALMFGIPDKFGRKADPTGAKRNALSKKLLSWLEPMFKKDAFEKNYCEAFKHEIPNCGSKAKAELSKKKGCGYTGSCGQFEKCINTNTAPYYRCHNIGADRFLGKTVKIYYDNCYLYWKGGPGSIHNAEYRCGKGADTFWIKKAPKADHYYIGYSNCPMLWKGGAPSTHNAEFRCGQTGDPFWIKEQKNGEWAIGYHENANTYCPMFWRGGSGHVHNAEFRCGSHIKDVFKIITV